MSSPINLPFIIGNDICRIARVRRILNGRLGRQFVHRILTTEEIQHSTTTSILRCVLDRKPPDAQNAQSHPRRLEEDNGDQTSTWDDVSFTRAIEFMAGRFAAKEAVIKAHPHRRLTFQTIAILRMSFGSSPSAGASMLDSTEPTHRDTVDHEEERTTRPEDDTLVPRSGPLVALIKADGAHPEMHASVSISHDTEYATAVCLGINPAFPLGPSMGAKHS